MKNLPFFLSFFLLAGLILHTSCEPEVLVSENLEINAELRSSACTTNVFCDEAYLVTDEVCVFDLQAYVDDLLASCPDATWEWSHPLDHPFISGNMVTIPVGSSYTNSIYIQFCPEECGLTHVTFFCNDDCPETECPSISAEPLPDTGDRCEYIIYYDCEYDLISPNGSVITKIPGPNGQCVYAVPMNQGETEIWTVNNGEGDLCGVVLECEEEEEEEDCNCEDVNTNIVNDSQNYPNEEGCCILEINTIIPSDFGCDFRGTLHGILPPDGFHPVVIETPTSPTTSTISICGDFLENQEVIVTVGIYDDNLQPLCDPMQIPYTLSGCN